MGTNIYGKYAPFEPLSEGDIFRLYRDNPDITENCIKRKFVCAKTRAYTKTLNSIQSCKNLYNEILNIDSGFSENAETRNEIQTCIIRGFEEEIINISAKELDWNTDFCELLIKRTCNSLLDSTFDEIPEFKQQMIDINHLLSAPAGVRNSKYYFKVGSRSCILPKIG